jgi:hypothetical protein
VTIPLFTSLWLAVNETVTLLGLLSPAHTPLTPS